MLKLIILFTVFIVEFSLYGQANSEPPYLSDNQFLSAEDTITFSSQQLYMETSVWVDYMPTIPSSGPRSHAVIFVRTKDKSPISSMISADAIWIINNGKAWKSWLPKVSPYPPYDKPEEIKRVISGHKWPVGTNVDVVIRLKDNNGKVYFLKSSNQLVRKTS